MRRSFTNRGRFRGTTERLVTALGILFTGLKVSAISQNQPVIIEIKRFKTSHFKESKTALLDREKLGAKEHVACPQSEPANNDIQLGAAWLVAAANCQGAGDQSRDGGVGICGCQNRPFRSPAIW
jgi:hypothetical protein